MLRKEFEKSYSVKAKTDQEGETDSSNSNHGDNGTG